MPLLTHRPVRTLVVVARHTLRMTQRRLGEALGASSRTAARWEAGQSALYPPALAKLAALVHPRDAALAAEIAAAAGQTLESLGIVAPPPPPAAPPPLPARLLVDAVVCVAADALGAAPATLRQALFAAFRRARELRLTVDDVEAALTPIAVSGEPAKSKSREKPKSSA
jgi:transcriptional regulator with XRE-family HTH domain